MDSQPTAAPLDINIPRKGQLIQDRFRDPGPEAPPFFSLVEFNLTGLCNRKCVFCPRVDPGVFPNTNDHIRLELYEKIVRELGALDYRGLVLHSGFGEPLLAKRLDVLIALTKEHCPRARLEMVTNGDAATANKLRRLFAAGLDTLLISMYDSPDQQAKFERMRDEAGLTDEQVVLRVRWLPPEQRYGIMLTNRGGLLEAPDIGVGRLKEPMKRRCHYPFYMVMVDWNGDVLLCTHDWGKKLIVGNLQRHTVQELWDSETMKRVRLLLADGQRRIAPCDGCDADGTLMGARHFNAWLTYYERRAQNSR
jgi:radical SAM protein with 4Fe4S-binding SPASM domain